MISGRAIALMAALSAQLSAGQPGTEVVFRTVARGTESKIQARHELVARTMGSWHLLWLMHSGLDTPPDVDAPREMAVGVFAGTRPPRAQSVQIVRVMRQNGEIVVRYRVQNGPVPAAMSSAPTPFHIIAFTADTAQVKFEEER
jgi:hypothetical protein